MKKIIDKVTRKYTINSLHSNVNIFFITGFCREIGKVELREGDNVSFLKMSVSRLPEGDYSMFNGGVDPNANENSRFTCNVARADKARTTTRGEKVAGGKVPCLTCWIM